MKKLLFLFSLIVFASACKTADHKPIDQSMNLEVISVNNEYVAEYEISMKIDMEKNKISGNSTCNTYGANFETKKNKLTIDKVHSTKKMCGEGEMKIEKEFLTNLDKVVRYNFDGETLQLFANPSTTVITAIVK